MTSAEEKLKLYESIGTPEECAALKEALEKRVKK